MAWKFSQSSGRLSNPNGLLYIVGYSGCGLGLNNPDAQDVKSTGPLPRGVYNMDKFWTVHPTVGSYAIELQPRSTVQMFGRVGFLIHGLNIKDPLHSSHGCPVIGNNEHRGFIWTSKWPDKEDRVFEVTE